MPVPSSIRRIGYGSGTYEDFVATLRRLQTEDLVDVRSAPYSRFKPEFSRDALARSLEGDGSATSSWAIRSAAGRTTGPATSPTAGSTTSRVDDGRHSRTGSPRSGQGHESGAMIVLMCSEGRPQECHRAKLVAAELVALRIPVVHVDEAGDVRTHDEIMGLVTGGRDALFDEPASATRSRRAHRVVS
jgi:uncharacterized protein (DUF488 family)